MPQNLILKFMDGQVSEVTLAKPFHPNEEEIEGYPSGSGQKTTYPLSEICAVLTLGKPRNIVPSKKGAVYQEVITATGEHYHVQIFNFETGFYGIPVESDSPYKSIFFTAHGIRERRKDHPLGQILEKEGLIPKGAVEEAIKDQQSLRMRRMGDVLAEQHQLDPVIIENTLQAAARKGHRGPKYRVGDILVDAGLVTREQVEGALASQQDGKRKKIGTLLIERGLINEEQLLRALASKFRMRFVDLDEQEPDPAALEALPKDVVRQLLVFPLDARAGHLVVATSEPTDPMIEDTLSFRTNRHIELVVATPSQIAEAIKRSYDLADVHVEELIGAMADEVEVIEEEKDEDRLSEADSQVIKLVNNILIDAYKKQVSDVHFEPELGKRPLRVRYRIDGICQLAHQIPATYKKAIISRIKILSRLDIAEHRRPQSGKIFLKAENQQVEYRVEITPTAGGHEDAVLRILSAAKPLSLDEMGFSPHNLEAFKEIVAKPHGIVLCVGPTGAGKTTSLHSALGHINTVDRKIWTAEDPIEITQPGLRQVQVHPKIGFTFAEALRSFLRADPDVIMIGEMRDPETAKIAIEASLTGHLVLSTLHTNSAPETVVRLIEMGMDPFNFADAFLGILAQRLARRLCEHCKEPYRPDRTTFETLVHAYGPEWHEKHQLPPNAEDLTLMKSVGCEKCDGCGYRGRVAIHELLVGSESVKDGIRKNLPVDELKALAMQEGMVTLKQDGIQKVLQGITDLDQVLKVCL